VKDLSVRKSIRLQGYDYSSAGYYFVTVCVKDGHEMLGKVTVGSGFHPRPSIELTDIGVEVQNTIEYICKLDEGVEIPQYVIMPNHVHMIVALNSVGHGSPTLQTVVGRIKSYIAKRWSEMDGTKCQTFWQRSFHDHIIRDESEYQRIWQYIDQNPARWTEDEYYV
jgi:REP element-mobilizing transposase RayT